MKKQLLSVLLSLVAIIAINIKGSAQATLIYNWDFNGGMADSAGGIPSYKVAGSGAANYKYLGAYIDFTNGSSLNIQTGDYAGNAIRFRNPADSVIFWMPTTGYKNIKFAYAEQRTTSGSKHNTVYYTTDGTHFVPASNGDAANATTYPVDSVNNVTDSVIGWQTSTYTFSLDTNTKENAHFGIAIAFVEGPDSTSGNNRFDNVTLKGDLTGTTPPSVVSSVTASNNNYMLFPNPVANILEISSNTAEERVFTIYNAVGQKIAEGENNQATFTVNTSGMAAGVYFLNICENKNGAISTMKFVKQ